MGLLTRIGWIFRAEASAALDRVEDPKQALDFGLVKMQENLQKVSRSLLDVAAAKRKLEMQRERLDENIANYERQAREALSLGREDLARVALERKQESVARRDELERSIGSVDSQLQSLERSRTSLRASIDNFRMRKEELAAVYDAARAQLQVRETLAGVSKEITDVGSAIQRAEDRIVETRVRVEALDELVAIGTVEDVLSADKDDIDRELARIGRSAAVDADLARLKGTAGGSEARLLDTPLVRAEMGDQSACGEYESLLTSTRGLQPREYCRRE